MIDMQFLVPLTVISIFLMLSVAVASVLAVKRYKTKTPANKTLMKEGMTIALLISGILILFDLDRASDSAELLTQLIKGMVFLLLGLILL